MEGLITTVQRLSTKDGPGIRTTVFLKGCNMECCWCHNPESISKNILIGFLTENCTFCNNCIEICKNNCLTFNNKTLNIDYSKCTYCGDCVDVCSNNALSIVGKYYETDELVKIILEDFEYFKNSNGGVTFSGGEPLLQTAFLVDVIKKLKRENIHIIIETNLSVSLNPELINLVDCFYIDIKSMNDEKHKNWTNISNKNILSNIRYLDKLNAIFEIRTPIIPNFNNQESDILQIKEFIDSLNNNIKYSLIPYHPMGLNKYKQFQIPIKYNNEDFLDRDIFDKLNNVLRI